MLIQQNRPKEAIEILSQLLADNPNDPYVLAMLAEVNINVDNSKEALKLLKTAISLAPDNPQLFYLEALASLNLQNLSNAEQSISEAVRLDPSEAEYYAIWAVIKIDRKQFDDGLELANKALDLDSENILALNARSKALLKLDRKNESFQTLEGALNEDPNNAYTHSNYGWSELEKGDHKKALEHFKEALKNNPNLEYAQAGMIESLKARYLLYRWFLAYAFWMGNLTAKYQWGVIIGFYVGFRIMKTIANTNPGLAPIIQPILIFLMIVALSTWITTPVSNLFLRLNYYGNHMLSKKDKMSSNLVGLCVLILLSGIAGFLVSNNEGFLAVIFFGFAMMIPFSVMFESTKQKYTLPVYAIIMSVVGILAIVNAFAMDQLFSIFSTIFIFGFIGFQWFANFVLIKENND